jgi:hypothetical protein
MNYLAVCVPAPQYQKEKPPSLVSRRNKNAIALASRSSFHAKLKDLIWKRGDRRTDIQHQRSPILTETRKNPVFPLAPTRISRSLVPLNIQNPPLPVHPRATPPDIQHDGVLQHDEETPTDQAAAPFLLQQPAGGESAGALRPGGGEGEAEDFAGDFGESGEG